MAKSRLNLIGLCLVVFLLSGFHASEPRTSKPKKSNPAGRNPAGWQENRIDAKSFVSQLVSLNEDIRFPALGALANLTSAQKQLLLPNLMAFLTSADNRTGHFAWLALEKMGLETKKALRLLFDQMKSRDAGRRRSAIQGLGHIAQFQEKIVPRLISSLHDADKEVRLMALGALGGAAYGNKKVIPPLVECLRDDDPDVRAMAAEAIGTVGPVAGAAVTDISLALKDKDRHVREAAARTLGRMGTTAKNAVGDLIKSLHDDEVAVRVAAAQALGAIGPDAKDAVPVLQTALHDDHLDVRQAAGRALEEMTLAERIAGFKENEASGSAEESYVERLVAYDDEIRLRAVEKLTYLGEEEKSKMMPLLISLMKTGSDEVVNFSAAALYKMAPLPSSAFLQLLKNENPVIRQKSAYYFSTVERGDKNTVPALIEALRDSEPYVRLNAAAALKKSGPLAIDAVPALTEALSDEDTDVQSEAAEALSRIQTAEEHINNKP